MVLVWLNQVKVIAETSAETILTVELELSHFYWVTREKWEAVAECQATEDIGEIGPLIVSKDAFEIIDFASADEIIVLNDPDEFFDWVIEVETNLVS